MLLMQQLQLSSLLGFQASLKARNRQANANDKKLERQQAS